MSKKNDKVIVIIKGGLGNQLFCYCAGRSLAVKNNAELILDIESGFKRDFIYKRHYSLNNFNINGRIANYQERSEPFGRLRRKILKKIGTHIKFKKCKYIYEEEIQFNSNLLEIDVSGKVILDGYWQSEKYFKDIEEIIRNDLKILSPLNKEIISLGDEFRGSNSVCLHVRWFDNPINNISKCKNNLPQSYYINAVEKMLSKVEVSQFYIFTEFPAETKNLLSFLPRNNCTYIADNSEYTDYELMWLMSNCQHFIIANSTFSWWGAWLAGNKNKQVICPDIVSSSWGYYGLIPENWIKL